MARYLHLAGSEGTGVKIALPVWNGRVSPVFDTAQQVIVVETEGQRAVQRTEESIGEYGPPAKVGRLTALGVEVLICGGISGAVAALVEMAGIQLVPSIAGQTEEVLTAFLEGRLQRDPFFMPGCGRRGRRFRRGRRGRGPWMDGQRR